MWHVTLVYGAVATARGLYSTKVEHLFDGSINFPMKCHIVLAEDYRKSSRERWT